MADAEGRPAHSWRVLLLPYLDQAELYNQYRFDEPWNGPHNSTLADQVPAVYRCPSFEKYHRRHNLETTHTRRLTNYVAIVDASAVFRGAETTTLGDIADGSSNTLAIAEARGHAVHWMQPDDVTPDEILADLQTATGDHRSNHVGGLQVLMSDGSVRFLSSNTREETFRALATRSGGEALGEF